MIFSETSSNGENKIVPYAFNNIATSNATLELTPLVTTYNLVYSYLRQVLNMLYAVAYN